MKRYDVVTFGETMIRLSPPRKERLEAASSLDYLIGGSESNTAVGLACLGRSVSWWSRLVNNPMGRKIADEVRRWGVDTSHILWTDTGRVGTYYVEFGSPPRPHHVYYDRADSAASHLAPDMVDWNHLDAFKHLHITGISLAISPSCKAAVLRSIIEARQRGLTISFDTNYRSKLWTAAEAKEAIAPVLSQVDLVFCPVGDADAVFGLRGEPLSIARQIQQRYSANCVLVTGSAAGAYAVRGEEAFHSINVPSVEVDRVGAGDAGNAGVLHGFLDGDLQLGMRYGSAMAALKHSIPGDMLLSSKEEIDGIVAGNGHNIRR